MSETFRATITTKEELIREGVVEKLSVRGLVTRAPVLIRKSNGGYFAYIPPYGSELKDRVVGPHGGEKEFVTPFGRVVGKVKPIELSDFEGYIVRKRRDDALAGREQKRIIVPEPGSMGRYPTHRGPITGLEGRGPH